VRLASDERFEECGAGRFRSVETGMTLSPLCDVHDMTREDSVDQILFE